VAESYPCPKTGRRGKGLSLGVNTVTMFKKVFRCMRINITVHSHLNNTYSGYFFLCDCGGEISVCAAVCLSVVTHITVWIEQIEQE
jgi:hypothetical protein